jgi:3-hydroxybutyryl-CoA dehydratase
MTAPLPSAMQPSPLALDFDGLKPGQRFTTRARTITESDVVAFATLTGDLHPQHVDADWAAASRFGERVAHGMLVLSYAVGLVPLDPDRVVALRRVREAVFKRPS